MMERAADDFATIAQRIAELRREREEAERQRADEPAVEHAPSVADMPVEF